MSQVNQIKRELELELELLEARRQLSERDNRLLEAATMYDAKQEDLEHACEERDELLNTVYALQAVFSLVNDTTPDGLRVLVDSVKALAAAKNDTARQLSEARSDLCFWKRAAEQAIAGWNQLEDSIEATHEVLDAIKSNVEAAEHLLNNDAPPAHEAPRLHVVPDAPPVTE